MVASGKILLDIAGLEQLNSTMPGNNGIQEQNETEAIQKNTQRETQTDIVKQDFNMSDVQEILELYHMIKRKLTEPLLKKIEELSNENQVNNYFILC